MQTIKLKTLWSTVFIWIYPCFMLIVRQEWRHFLCFNIHTNANISSYNELIFINRLLLGNKVTCIIQKLGIKFCKSFYNSYSKIFSFRTLKYQRNYPWFNYLCYDVKISLFFIWCLFQLDLSMGVVIHWFWHVEFVKLI